MSYEDGPCGGYGYDEPYYCVQAGCLCYGGDCDTCEAWKDRKIVRYDTEYGYEYDYAD